MQEQSQAEARILSLIAEARPSWDAVWHDGGGGYWHMWDKATGQGSAGFLTGWADGWPNTRAGALARAVERAAAKGWK